MPSASSVVAPPSVWLARYLRRPSARLRLFCLPFAGSGATVYANWAESLPDTIELCPIQLPGRETRFRENAHDRLTPLVQELEQALRPYLDKPFAFFGHSLGALIAFELTRRLRRFAAPLPVHLFVSARRAPHLPDPDSALHQLPDDAFVDGLQRRYNAIPDVILQDPEYLQLFLPTLRADFAVVETYAYHEEPALDCPITGFCGREDSRATPEAMAGWQSHTRAAFHLETFPGGHFYLQSARAHLLHVLASSAAPYL